MFIDLPHIKKGMHLLIHKSKDILTFHNKQKMDAYDIARIGLARNTTGSETKELYI